MKPTLTRVRRPYTPLPAEIAVLEALEAAVQVEAQRCEAVTLVADHLCVAVALSQLDRLSDAVLLERATMIVAAVVALTRGRG